MTANILSLSRVRKAKVRAVATKQAGQNRVIFGRTKAEKIRDKAEKDRIASVVDGARLEVVKDPQSE
jgi:hypothetical protein